MSPILSQLAEVSSAEEIFTLLGLEADPAVLNVARLHILRRMRDYVASVPEEASDEEARAVLRTALSQAYSDFLASSPLKERVFKVLREAARPKRTGFVPLASLFPTT